MQGCVPFPGAVGYGATDPPRGAHLPTEMYDISRPRAPTHLQKSTTFRKFSTKFSLPTEMYDISRPGGPTHLQKSTTFRKFSTKFRP